jgi:hypothetical protein
MAIRPETPDSGRRLSPAARVFGACAQVAAGSESDSRGRVFLTFAGTPATSVSGGTSEVTTAPATATAR